MRPPLLFTGALLPAQCLAYGRGAAAGSLCQPLCSRRLTFRRCVGHGVKVHVLEAEWAGHTVILKAPALLESDAGLADLRLPAQGPALSRAHFMEWVGRQSAGV